MRFLTVVLTTLLLATAGCGGDPPREAPEPTAPPLAEPPGFQNLRRVSPHVYSGGEPQGVAAFRALARLGIRTIVSVDAARPDIEAARAAGLRYVHIPIGYDGIPREAAASLTRVARDIAGQTANPRDDAGSSGQGPVGRPVVHGPVYVHCHHGRHRAPAAAAIVCVAAGEVDARSATRILEDAGTSRDYAGLWRDVATFTPAPPDAVLPELVEVAQVDSLIAAMASIDRAWDRLQLCREAGWKPPPDHPDLVPVREAILLKEGFREAVRPQSDTHDERLREWLLAAEADALALETALSQAAHRDAAALLSRLGDSCQRCHAQYRD